MKIFSGFVILAVVLFVAGSWSIYELNRVGASVQQVLDQGYARVHGARMMIEALQREDSGTLLLFQGRWEEGREILASADSLFEEGLRQAQGRDGSVDAAACLDEIRSRYDAYQVLWAGPIAGTEKEGDLSLYFEGLHRASMDVKASVNRLLDQNDRVIYDTATELRNRSNRAIMPGIVAVVAAFVFTLIFNFFVNFYVVSPMVKIHQGIQRFLGNNVPFDVEIETNDEIADLARDVERLCTRIQPEDGGR
jgi:NtrC-family two-component system sensor histidine kinase KinB